MAQSPNNPDPFEFLKSLWSPMGIPMPGMVTPTLDPAEIDKRIADLKSVENWLSLNLNVLRMTIQGLEMQKATLSAMQSGMADPMKTMQQAGATPGPGDAWWTILQQAQEAAMLVGKSVPDDIKGKKK